MASITVRLVAGRNTRASRLCIPQSSPADPLRVYGCGRAVTDGENRPASPPPAMAPPPPPAALLSLSGMALSPSAEAVGGLHCLAPCGPPERVEQVHVGHCSGAA